MEPGNTSPDHDELRELCRQARVTMIRTVANAGAGHLGGSLSAVEMLIVLYFGYLRIRPQEPDWEERDRFVLSKGHATPLYYTVLAMRGYFPRTWLDTFDSIDSLLQGHPDMRKTPGVDMTTGSLGQGFSAALGMAMAGAHLEKSFRTVCMIGDGELQEGQTWETIMYAGARRVPRFVCITDQNGLQLASTIDDGLPYHPVEEKWRAFGWEVLSVDGNDVVSVSEGLAAAWAHSAGPVAIISRTTKGKGVSFMEQVVKWHSACPTPEETVRALEELGAGAQD